MKKTLCKVIHEFDDKLFICIEDIFMISKSYKSKITNLWVIGISLINFEEHPIYIELKSKNNSEELRDNIIKELEEYYGMVNKR